MGFHGQGDTPFTLDPRIEIPDNDGKAGLPRATGNQVSVEFNLLYRFHSAISIRDRKWSENFFKLYLNPKYGVTTEQVCILFENS